MHLHAVRSELDIDEEDEPEDNDEQKQLDINTMDDNVAYQHDEQCESYNNDDIGDDNDVFDNVDDDDDDDDDDDQDEDEEEDDDDDDDDDEDVDGNREADVDEEYDGTVNVFSPMSGSHSSNNNRYDEQLLTPTISPAATSSTNISALTNINLDNCNANVNDSNNIVHQSTFMPAINNISNNHITNAPTGTLNRNRKPFYNQQTNQNTSTNRSQNFQLNPNHNLSQFQNQQNPNSVHNQNRNISSSLEIILSPIIQSSRR